MNNANQEFPITDSSIREIPGGIDPLPRKERHQTLPLRTAAGDFNPPPESGGDKALIAELALCLREAVDLICFFHGQSGYDIYALHSPEMKRIRGAIAKAEGRR